MNAPSPAKLKRRRRMMIFAGAGLMLAFAAFLVLRAFQDNLVFFITPSDVQAGEDYTDRRFRLGGLVADNSVQQDGTSVRVRFRVTDGMADLPVVYDGILPDLFREGQGVVAEGRLGADGVFRAESVLAKHDETYMPPEVAKALKEKGYWQQDAAGEGGAR